MPRWRPAVRARPRARHSPLLIDPNIAMETYQWRVEDFCYNRHTVEVNASDRDEAAEKMKQKVDFSISAAWLPGRGERAP